MFQMDTTVITKSQEQVQSKHGPLIKLKVGPGDMDKWTSLSHAINAGVMKNNDPRRIITGGHFST